MQAKKNLGLMQMQYKDVYVAIVGWGTGEGASRSTLPIRRILLPAPARREAIVDKVAIQG